MKLAKECVDIGVRTNNKERMLKFWTETVGLPYEELLKLGGGVHQHRLGLNGSVFKLNHARETIPDTAPTGYHHLYIASDDREVKHLVDPDGSLVTLLPRGSEGITHIGIGMKVKSLPDAQVFFRDVLQADSLGDNRFRIGTTVFLLQQAEPGTPAPGGFIGKGFRYITVQVHKVDTEHKGLVARGAIEDKPPEDWGTTARVSFITDSEGNVIEISQRASLVGHLNGE